MKSGYGRSVILRVADAAVSIAIWLGLIVFALDNLDTGLPDSEGLGGGWPFWIADGLIVGIVALFLSRYPGSPGWGTFLIGLLISEIVFFINRLLATEVSIAFLIFVIALALVPLPGRRRENVETSQRSRARLDDHPAWGSSPGRTQPIPSASSCLTSA